MTAEKKKKSKKTRSLKVSQLSGKRLWAFRIVALVVIPLLFFGGLELILRLFDVGYPTDAAIQRRVDGRTVYCNNSQFTWRFFPHNIARDFHGFVFDAEKSPGTYRIFVLGASAAAGVPEPAYNFGRILEVILNERYPQINFEVITMAIAAINSHVVLEIAKDCAGYAPDLFIVYLGHNEVVGPFGPGTVFSSVSPSLSFIRANIALKSTRIGQLADRILDLAAPRGTGPQRWDGMAMFLEKQVHHDCPALESVYSYFEKNLDDICRVARRTGAAVIISNVGCNLKDSPPFASLHKEMLSETEKQKWQQVYQQGIEHETAGEYQRAIKNYQAAAEIDQTFADLQFRLGRSYWKTGEYETARQHYHKALQYDTLRFRADARINEIIRSVAEGKTNKGIYFADSIATLEENSPHHTPGEELFYEHVHLNFTGNYNVAKTLFAQIQDLLPVTVKQHPGPALSEEQCAQRLTYTPVDRCFLLSQIRSIVSKPPYTNQLYHDEFIKKTGQQIKDLNVYLQPSRLKQTLDQYEKAVGQNPNDWQLLWRYSQILGMVPKYSKANEIQLRNIIKLCPHNASAYLYLGRNLYQHGNYNEAQKILYQLLDLKPNSAQGHFGLAKMYRTLKDYKKCIRHLNASLSIESALSIELHITLAEAYFLSGDANKAISILYKAIESFPEEETARGHAYLGYLLGTQGEYKKALQENKLALKIDPNYVNEKGFQEYLNRLEARVKP